MPRPEVEFAAFFAFDDYMTAYETTGRLTKSGLATLAGVVLFDEWKIAYLRRDDEAYIPQPESVKAVVAVAMYGRRVEVEPASKVVMELGRSLGGKYLGDEISAGDWASRHDRYATPLHGRDKDGQAVMMSWHCEDAALNYSVLPQVREEWHAIVARYRERYGIFDDWGMFAYTSGPYKPWADYLVEIDVGIWESRLDDETWAGWVACKREIAEVSLKYGGSITACHGATRAGDAELVPTEMGSVVGGGQAHQARAGPEQRHEPRQADAGRGLRVMKSNGSTVSAGAGTRRGGRAMSIFRLGDQKPPEPQRITDAVIMRFEHVYEVDPALMELTGQQDMPAWDTMRIVDSRWEHLDWMHDHFADAVILAGEESETMPPGRSSGRARCRARREADT